MLSVQYLLAYSLAFPLFPAWYLRPAHQAQVFNSDAVLSAQGGNNTP